MKKCAPKEAGAAPKEAAPEEVRKCALKEAKGTPKEADPMSFGAASSEAASASFEAAFLGLARLQQSSIRSCSTGG